MEPTNQRPVMDVARPQKSALPSAVPPVPRPAAATPVTARPAVSSPTPSATMSRPSPLVDRPAVTPSATPDEQPPVASAPEPTMKPTPASVESKSVSSQSQEVAPAPLAVRQAPKYLDADAKDANTAQPSQQDAQPTPQPKPKQATGQHGPAGVIVVTVLVMIALSALTIAIYLNV